MRGNPFEFVGDLVCRRNSFTAETQRTQRRSGSDLKSRVGGGKYNGGAGESERETPYVRHLWIKRVPDTRGIARVGGEAFAWAENVSATRLDGR